MRCVDGLTCRGIAAEMGGGLKTIERICQRHRWSAPGRADGRNLWSEADDGRLREMWQAGVPVQEILAALDRDTTSSAIHQRAMLLQVRRPENFMSTVNRSRLSDEELATIRRLRFKRGLTCAEIAARTGHSVWKVTKVCRDRGWTRAAKNAGGRPVSWTAADVATLTELWLGGARPREIARALERDASENAVNAKARELKLTRRRAGPRPKNEPRPPVRATPVLVRVRPPRSFSEIETRRIRQFARRGDTHADIARQMRCDVEDIRRIAGSADRVPQGEDCGGAGARRQPTRTTTAPRYNFFRESHAIR